MLAPGLNLAVTKWRVSSVTWDTEHMRDGDAVCVCLGHKLLWDGAYFLVDFREGLQIALTRVLG